MRAKTFYKIDSLRGDPRSEARKPKKNSVLLGQVFTPSQIADEMSQKLLEGRPATSLAILDPCVGPGTFLSALKRSGKLTRSDKIVAFDVDEAMIEQAVKVSKVLSRAQIYAEDFLVASSEHLYDLAILNPPYIRQEWIALKQLYRSEFNNTWAVDVPGTSNLYVYFLTKVIQLLKPGGKFSCIVYDSWQSTRYGQWLLSFIGKTCKNVEFHPVRQQPFDGHLIDAVIIYGTRKAASEEEDRDTIEMERPSLFSGLKGFLPIERLFSTRRGLRLKQADFFLCELAEFEGRGAVPFVKKLPGHKGFSIPSDHNEGALLISQYGSNAALLRELKRRLKLAEQNPEQNVSILTWYKERPSAWFSHGTPPKAPIIFNYYLRNRPRHINNDRIFSDNFYGLTPLSESTPLSAWIAVLNSTATCVEILSHARNQGSGLAKVQLFEYRKAAVLNVAELGSRDQRMLSKLGERLLLGCEDPSAVIKEIDDAIHKIAGHASLKQKSLMGSLQDTIAASRMPRLGRDHMVTA
jgi:adenine-specific DNA-methyltransferase